MSQTPNECVIGELELNQISTFRFLRNLIPSLDCTFRTRMWRIQIVSASRLVSVISARGNALKRLQSTSHMFAHENLYTLDENKRTSVSIALRLRKTHFHGCITFPPPVT
jgi:hypothetical protein